jgi:hypothetical protein
VVAVVQQLLAQVELLVQFQEQVEQEQLLVLQDHR